MKPFEQEAVRLLAEGHVAADVLARLYTAPEGYCDHTGAGYFLTIRDEALPAERTVLNSPVLMGRAGDTEVGFVVFVMDHELTLECHGWGGAVPADIREADVVVSVALNVSGRT